MTDLEHAKYIFLTGGYSCVLYKDGVVFTSTLTGISPLVKYIAAGSDLKGFSAADKIVGKAAAMLFVLAGVKEVYAGIMSEQAIRAFQEYNVQYSYDTLVPAILNRSGTDLCPMEQAVRKIENPFDAFNAVRHTLEMLKSKKVDAAK